MSFISLGIPQNIANHLQKIGYLQPTPIQEQAIPLILQQFDVMGAAQTGTGKTAAFVLPILCKLVNGERPKPKGVKAIIIAPTRELAGQIADNVKMLSENMEVKSYVVFGGVKTEFQIEELRQGIDILVATPGRLLDLYGKHAVRFDQVETIVLDEADKMLDLGFYDDISEILRLMPKNRQSLLFSATFSDSIRKLAKTFLKEPKEVSVTPKNAAAITVSQYIHPVDEERKVDFLIHLLTEHQWPQVIVFVNTKDLADQLTQILVEKDFQAVAIHSDKPQTSRIKTFSRFKEGSIPILVATDIAARGLDIDQLPAVINFEIPVRPENYVHRVGRTGRAESEGLAISIVCAKEIYYLNQVEDFIHQPLKRVYVAEFAPLYAFPEKADIDSVKIKKNNRNERNRRNEPRKKRSSNNKKN